MSSGNALLTFSIGPVHAFIAQARRVADLWTGSDLLSHLMGEAIREAQRRKGDAVFPEVRPGDDPPRGLPNRVVCRVPEAQAEEVAKAMEQRVRTRWDSIVAQAAKTLNRYGVGTAALWDEAGAPGSRQTDHVFQVSWSWVPETPGHYSEASRKAVQRFNASRLFRPFEQIDERSEKCAICGERMALPDGVRQTVASTWKEAEEKAEGTPDERFFRLDQTRLCLVCAAKRLYPRPVHQAAYFSGFDQFHPEKEKGKDFEKAYFALVSMDGDRMGDILTWPAQKVAGGDLERFHRELSAALSRFAASLRDPIKPWLLSLGSLEIEDREGKSPQLIYAGGEDVLLVCDPRDALRIAGEIRKLYRHELEAVKPLLADPGDFDKLTISAAILFAHSKHAAGLVFNEVGDLLDRKAKAETGRDAVALRLVKRGGVPVEVAFKWNEAPADGGPTWVERFADLIRKLAEKDLSSRQSYHLRQEEEVLIPVFAGEDGETDETRRVRWQRWLADRLAKSEVSAARAEELAGQLAPFFLAGRTEALRLARFLGVEVPALRAHQTGSEEKKEETP